MAERKYLPEYWEKYQTPKNEFKPFVDEYGIEAWQWKGKWYVKDPSLAKPREHSTENAAKTDYQTVKAKYQTKPVDITKIQSQITDNQFEIDELEDQDELSKQETGILKLLKEERKNLFYSAGQDTTGMDVPQVDAAEGSRGILQRIGDYLTSDSDDIELSESRWKSKKRKEIMGLIASGKLQIPEEYAGRNYEYRDALVNAAWKDKMEKPAASKKVSGMTTQELKDYLDANK